MTSQDLDQLRDDIMALTERTIDENLRDPDLVTQSLEYHAGYRRGFKEAALTLILQRLTKKH